MPAQEVVSVSDFRANLASYINKLTEGEQDVIFIGPHRKPQVALVRSDVRQPEGTIPSLALIRAKSDTLWRLARSYGISRLAVFGSVARGEAKAGSDIDIAVDADERAGLFDLTNFALDVENLFSTKAQVISLGSLLPGRHDAILRDLVFLEDLPRGQDLAKETSR